MNEKFNEEKETESRIQSVGKRCARLVWYFLKIPLTKVGETSKHFTWSKPEKCLYLFPDYFKNKTQEVPEILSNYFKNKTQDELRFFEITSKTRPAEGPPDSFNLLQKQNTIGLRDSFKLSNKINPRGVPGILSNYFKKKTKEVPEIL